MKNFNYLELTIPKLATDRQWNFLEKISSNSGLERETQVSRIDFAGVKLSNKFLESELSALKPDQTRPA